jgi:hypothetical protein
VPASRDKCEKTKGGMRRTGRKEQMKTGVKRKRKIGKECDVI